MIFFFIKNIKTILKIKKQDKSDLAFWLKTGLKIPPPDIVKHNIIIKYQKKEKIKVFVGNANYVNKREVLLKINFNSVCQYSNFNLDCITKIKDNSIIFIDSKSFLEYKTKDEILLKVKEIINIISNSTSDHIVMWDNAHLFLKNSDFPNLHELKTLFLNKKDYYSCMKSENNIFVMAPNL